MFLPFFSRLVLLLALCMPGCGSGHVAIPPPTMGDNPFEVVAGTGDVAPEVLDRVAGLLRQELDRLRPILVRAAIQRFFVHVHADRESMPTTLTAHLHPDSPGFAVLGTHQIHLVWGEIRRTGAMPRGVVAHELVHELLDQLVAPNGRYIPRWFHEGLAQFLAGDTYLGAREDDLIWRVGTRRLIPFSTLREGFPLETDELRIAYAQSYSYVAYLEREHGLGELLWIARAADDFTSFEQALVGRLDRSTLELEDGWRDYLVHGSGAPWRVALENCFSLCLIAALPVLVLALMRRLRAEQRAARHLVDRAAAEAEAAAAVTPPEAETQPESLLDEQAATDEDGRAGDDDNVR